MHTDIPCYIKCMKEYPITFLVRLQPKHKNIIKKASKKWKWSEAAVIRGAIEDMGRKEGFTNLAPRL